MPRSRRRPPSPQVEALLDQAAAAFEDGKLEDVLDHAKAALERDPDCVEALHFRGSALLESDQPVLAREAFERAVKLAPDEPALLLALADVLIAEHGEERGDLAKGLELAAKGAKIARKLGDDELGFDFALLQGVALNQVGECEQALARLDEALAMVPGDSAARLERALALFELCRFDDARKDLQAVLERDEDEAFAHHYLGLIAERGGDQKEAKRRFARATELAPDDFPAPVRLSEAEFDAAVEDGVKQLPEHVKKYLENTTIAVEPIPADDDLTAEKPPLSPCILGVFRGTPVGQRSVDNAADHVTASIVLYQRNLERFARSRDELIEQIGITLMHEVGHLIGLDEEDLWERGLD